ncbi:hypothetical protein QAD02_020943 [Eretmocerus hayati]|uniref:Uncharacterized protein n=1 Tax=Eretmocerus hayati TaxID=131215 RepID=A0ACC2PNG3_9HYME|nr:hypothetical protein QAD02_020943 [Eretmocerus hayati]
MSYLISVSDVLTYAGDGVRKFVEGEAVADANHIMYMGITLESFSKIELLSLCVKSSDLFGAPHELLLNISRDKDGNKSLLCKCSCIAGSPTCKHIIGSLTYLMRNEKKNIENATCTDVKQKWGKLKKDVKAMYSYVPMKKHCHGKQKDSSRVRQMITIDIKEFAFNLMVTDHPGSLLSLSLNGLPNRPEAPFPLEDPDEFLDAKQCRSILSAPICLEMTEDSALYSRVIDGSEQVITFGSLSEAEKSWYQSNVAVTLESAVDLCMKTKSQSGRIWKAARRKRMTGANAYKYITPLRYPGKVVNWNDKVHKQLQDTFKGNANTNHGIRMEPIARAKYAEISGFTVTKTGSLVNPNLPWLLTSLDGIVLGSHTIEIKCPVDGKSKTVDEIIGTLSYIETSESGIYSLKKKHTYYCQVQLGMFVSNLKYCDFIIYSSYENGCGVIRVPYDEDVMREYLKSLQYVYFCHMLKVLVAADLVSDDVKSCDASPRKALGDVTNK